MQISHSTEHFNHVISLLFLWEFYIIFSIWYSPVGHLIGVTTIYRNDRSHDFLVEDQLRFEFFKAQIFEGFDVSDKHDIHLTRWLSLVKCFVWPSYKIFYVLFRLWWLTMQSEEFTGNPPSFSSSSLANSTINDRSLTLPALCEFSWLHGQWSECERHI